MVNGNYSKSSPFPVKQEACQGAVPYTLCALAQCNKTMKIRRMGLGSWGWGLGAGVLLQMIVLNKTTTPVFATSLIARNKVIANQRPVN